MNNEKRKAFADLDTLNDQLEALNVKLEESNARMTAAILILTDIIADLMPHIVTDPATLDQLTAATAAAKKAALI